MLLHRVLEQRAIVLPNRQQNILYLNLGVGASLLPSPTRGVHRVDGIMPPAVLQVVQPPACSEAFQSLRLIQISKHLLKAPVCLNIQQILLVDPIFLVLEEVRGQGILHELEVGMLLLLIEILGNNC